MRSRAVALVALAGAGLLVRCAAFGTSDETKAPAPDGATATDGAVDDAPQEAEPAMDAGVDACGPDKHVFVSTSRFPLTTGRNGADTICRLEAEEASLCRQYIAWLSVAGSPAIDRLTYDGGYRRVDGTVVFADRAALAAGGAADGGVRLQASGKPAPDGAGVATGTLADGGIGSTCAEWAATASQSFTGGTTTAGGAAWTQSGTYPCSAQPFVYCFEQ